MSCLHLASAIVLLFSLMACQFAAAQEFREVFFDEPTGDFGLDDNWSDPMWAPPEEPPGADFSFQATQYYIHEGRTATISAGSPNGSSFSVYHFFPGDSPAFNPDLTRSDIPPSPGTLIMEGGVPPAPGEFGARLEVLGTNRLILGQRCNLGGITHGMDPCTGGGEIIMNGASEIVADGIVVGERASGSLFIGPDASVISGRIADDSVFLQDFRIGSFGPSRGETEPIPVRLEGNGLVVVQGSLLVNTLIMPESGATGELRLEGGDITLHHELLLNFQPERASRSSKVSIVGSEGTFTLVDADIEANHPSVTFSFTADANGVTPIVTPAVAEIEGANLELDLDDFQFAQDSRLTLIDAGADDFGGLLFGEFGTVTFLGNTTADVNYDIDNGDVFLDNFQGTVMPLIGDFNNNGLVEQQDLDLVLANWGKTAAEAPDTWSNDPPEGNIDQIELDKVLGNWGNSAGSLGTSTAVPEPSTCGLVVVGMAALGLLRRRWR